MNTFNIDAFTSLLEQLDRTAEWRDALAERYPEDERNQEAAKLLREVSDELPKFKGSDLHQGFERAANGVDVEYFGETLSDTVRRIGFSFGSTSAQDLLDWLCRDLERRAELAA